MAGGSVKTDSFGNPLMMRDSHLASVNFDLENQGWDKVPRPKFLFYVRFVKSNQSSAGSNQADTSSKIGIVVKYIDRPNVSFETETLNQYNKKRVVQSKVNYGEVTIRFHDTVDSQAFLLFEEYFKFYYGDSHNQATTGWNWDINAPEMQRPGNDYWWGFNAPQDQPNNSYFFSHIEIFQIYGGKFAQTNLIHPKIISFDPDALDFTDGQITHEVTMRLAYEGIVFLGTDNPIENSPLVDELNLNLSSYYEPSDSVSSTNPVTKHNYGVTGNQTGSLYSGSDFNSASLSRGLTNSTPYNQSAFANSYNNNFSRYSGYQSSSAGTLNYLSGTTLANGTSSGTLTGNIVRNQVISPLINNLLSRIR